MNDNQVQIESWGPFAEGKNDIFSNKLLQSIADKHNKTIAQVVLRWLTQRGVVAIPKSVRKQRMEENFNSLDFKLTAGEMEQIKSLDTKTSSFFDHRDPAMVKWLGERKLITNHKIANMKRLILLSAVMFATMYCKVMAQTSIFPKGEISKTDNHTGTIWLNELSMPDSTFNYSIALATYAENSKLDWHIHPAGQILMITEGAGYYQEKGQPARIVRKGDIIKCQPGVPHWHGALPNSTFAYLAVTPAQKGKTIWLQRVTDAEYKAAKKN